MAEPLTRRKTLSVEEYLEYERDAEVRHEYVAGMIHAHVGTTKRHARIVGNISARLWIAARGGPCRVYASDVKARVSDDVFYYPDVMVACGPDEGDPLYEEEPCFIVEVTSSSTRDIDRREKLAAYKKLPTLKSYLIVEQEESRVEIHHRDERGYWWHSELQDEGTVPITCPETTLTLADIYENL